MSTHSCVISPHLKDSISFGEDSKYGQLFPNLPALEAADTALVELGRSGAILDAISTDPDDAASDSSTTPAAWPFFGQFIAHDITADRSLLAHHARLGELRNFRHPALDLECIYGLGPGGTPYMYDVNDLDKFLLGTNGFSRNRGESI